jgi:preprotein translocase subunit SecG
MAFGAGTADALFGAGSGNALTKITKYAAIAFLALALVLGYLQSKPNTSAAATDFTKMVEQQQQQKAPTVAPQEPAKPQTAPSAGLLSTPMAVTATNAPAPAKTNPAK